MGDVGRRASSLKSGRETIISTGFETQEYVQDLEAHILTVDRDSALATITRLNNARDELSKELVSHEQTKGSLIAWVGTALVALGVNILTADDGSALGLGILLAGAALEVAAYIVRKHSAVTKAQPGR